MAKLHLSLAVGDYDRNRPLVDGAVQIDGVTPVTMTLSPEEMFFRAMRHEAFDITELSLSSYTLRVARGDCPYIGIPAFVSRAFRHTSIIVRSAAGIETPADLVGRRVGIAEWQLTANVWARALLEEQGVGLADVTWVRGGIEEAGRIEKIGVTPPAGVVIEDIGPGRTLKEMLAQGEIDAFVGPRLPTSFTPDNPDLRWLFDDPIAAASAYYARTRIFPIMHLIGIRRPLVEAHPWLPMAVLKAFEASKAMALQQLSDPSASKVTLPFVEEQLARARQLLGADFWPYGFDDNRHTLDYFLDQHHRQGISGRRLAPEDLFHASTLERYKL